MAETPVYRIVFMNRNEAYEIYAKHVFQGDLYGFVVAEDFIFGETSSIVVDPSEEKLKSEFSGVKRSFIPMHEVIRIDQVERRGSAKIVPVPSSSDSPGKPSTVYTPDAR